MTDYPFHVDLEYITYIAFIFKVSLDRIMVNYVKSVIHVCSWSPKSGHGWGRWQWEGIDQVEYLMFFKGDVFA